MKKFFLVIVSLFYSICLFANGIKIDTQTIAENSDNPKYSIYARYPQIVGKNLSDKQQQFNAEAKRWVVSRVDRFKQSLEKWDTSHLPTDILENGSYLNIRYDVMTVEPQVLMSLRYLADYNLVGSAHPNQEYTSINYDLRNGKVLRITDLFKSYASPLQRLSDYAEQTLRPKLGNSLFKEGLAPTLKNFAVWNINKKGIKLTFNNYQVAPYVFGPQEVTVPFRFLENLISDQSAILPCIKNEGCYFKRSR